MDDLGRLATNHHQIVGAATLDAVNRSMKMLEASKASEIQAKNDREESRTSLREIKDIAEQIRSLLDQPCALVCRVSNRGRSHTEPSLTKTWEGSKTVNYAGSLEDFSGTWPMPEKCAYPNVPAHCTSYLDRCPVALDSASSYATEASEKSSASAIGSASVPARTRRSLWRIHEGALLCREPTTCSSWADALRRCLCAHVSTVAIFCLLKTARCCWFALKATISCASMWQGIRAHQYAEIIEQGIVAA